MSDLLYPHPDPNPNPNPNCRIYTTPQGVVLTQGRRPLHAMWQAARARARARVRARVRPRVRAMVRARG